MVKELNLLCGNMFTFLYVGRMVRDKGLDELINAFLRIKVGHPSSRLLLVGPYEDNLDPIASETRLAIETNQDIRAVGTKTGIELLSYYAASDCFVLPSYREGFPNTVLEAGAMGLPSIVTDINGSREIINDGYNGLIVPPHDAYSLYVAMKRIIECPGERMRMASVAREFVATHFEQSFVRKCLFDYYHSILKNNVC